MPADGSLKRLGGGRWETRDGRFAIEPQSGTWVVVDTEQTDDLGLPLVRGPFGSLTAAKDAIETARGAGPATSPLAERLAEAQAAGSAGQKPAVDARAVKAAAGTARGVSRASHATEAGREEPQREAASEPAPEAPPEPKWLRDLPPARRRVARDLLERLVTLGIANRDEIAKAEIVRDQPALARLAIERRLREAVASAADPAQAVGATLKVLAGGRDVELDVRWRLVDDRGRLIDDLELPH